MVFCDNLLNKLCLVCFGPYDRSQIWDRIEARFSLSQGAAVAVFMAVWVCFV